MSTETLIAGDVVVGLTGTQQGMTESQRMTVRRILRGVGATVLHHGDCIGADAQAHDIALVLGCRVHLHPPREPRKRAWCKGAVVVHPPRPYLERDHGIVDAVDYLIAAPHSTAEQRRSGTWATVRYARARSTCRGRSCGLTAQ